MASSVTAYSDMDPSPRAILDIDPADLAGTTTTITIWQLSKWGQVTVRGAVRRNPAGGLVVTDYELPPGVPVTYRVEQFNASGVSLGFVLSLTTQVTVPTGWVVIQDPLAPRAAVLLRATPQFGASLTRKRNITRYQAGGNTFAMSGPYSAFVGVPIGVYTETEADRFALAEVLEEPLILVRTGPQMRLPGAFYATLADVPMIPIDARFDDGEMDSWDLSADEITRPDLEILAAVFSYDHFKAYLDTLHPPTPGTYADAAAIWATYIDAMRNPPPEV